MSEMSHKFDDRTLARAFILLCTAVQDAKVINAVRAQIPAVKEQCNRLAENIDRMANMNNAFSAIYTVLLPSEKEENASAHAAKIEQAREAVIATTRDFFNSDPPGESFNFRRDRVIRALESLRTAEEAKP